MAEHDADRDEGREPEEGAVPAEAAPPAPDTSQSVPFDEEAVWAEIVAGYGEEPVDPPGTRPFRSIEDLALLESPDDAPDDADAGTSGPDRTETLDKTSAEKASAQTTAPPESADGQKPDTGEKNKDTPPPGSRPLGSSVLFLPGDGPRDYGLKPPEDGDLDDGEGHFVPPEPPPLPEADVTAKFAWLAVLGGPVLLLLAVLLGWEMTWWLSTLGVGGFLGGFATLVIRMKDDDEDSDDPGRGAVV